MTPEFFFQLLALFGACATVYAAIKSDLTKAILKAEEAHRKAQEAHGTAGECHTRLDRHIEVKH